MTILVGLLVEWMNCVGASTKSTLLFESAGVHEAAVETLRCNWSNSWQQQHVLNGEFHDTSTHRTWTVDSRGHTQKDYHSELETIFRSRWETEP